MQYIMLPHTDLKLSQIILGTDYFGTSRSKETAFAIMDAYWEHGGNVLDTARVYGAWFPGGDGASEAAVGEYIKSRGIRDACIISSKAGHPPLDNMHIGRLSRTEIESDIDVGLSKLGTDYIDILWLHRDDPSRPVEDILETLNAMVQKGKIRCYGASNWTAARLAEANQYAVSHGIPPFAASQIQWSLARCTGLADDTLVLMNDSEEKFYAQSGLPVFAFSSQAKGFFEKYDQKRLEGKAYDRYLCEENLQRYQRLKELSLESGLSLSALSIAYLMSNETFPVFPIIGASRPEQVLDSMQAANFPIPDAIRQWRKADAVH